MPTSDTSQTTRTQILSGKEINKFHRLNPYSPQGGRYYFSPKELVYKNMGKMLGKYYPTIIISNSGSGSSTYSIRYFGNGNTGGTAPTDGLSPYSPGLLLTILGNSGSLTRTGYQFAGWNTSADGTGINYIGEKKFRINANTVLYAQWIIGGIQFVYDAGTGGSGTAPPSSGIYYTTFSTVDVVGNTGTFTNGSKVFGGWNTAINGSGTSYPAGSKYIIPSSGIVTLYAQWIDPATTYTLTYNAGTSGSGTAPALPTTYSLNAPATILRNTGPYTNSDPTKIFYGWNTEANGSGTSYQADSTITIIANTTLYVQWVSATPQYTVTYDANGATDGTVPATPTNYPGEVQVPILGQNTLTRPGYTFLGWNSSSNGIGSFYVPGYTFTSKTTTLYAQWAPGSTVKNCGGVTTTTGSGNTTITYIFPYAQIIQSSDTITIYTSALLGTTTSDYGSGAAPLGIISITSKTVITKTTIQINVNTTYSNSANDFNYANTITNGVDTTYWPSGKSITSITYPTLNLTNSLLTATYGISTKNSVNGCGLSVFNGTQGSTSSIYNFFNQTFILNFSDNTTTFIANSPNNVFNTVDAGSTWSIISRQFYPYANIVPKPDNALTTITIIPSSGSEYISPSMPNYTVEYNGNGNTGGNIPRPQYMIPYITGGPTSISLRQNNTGLVKDGFTFIGWNTAADGSGTDYAFGSQYNGGANLRLYAKWA